MLFLLVASHLLQTQPTAADYFALTPGTKRTFVETGGNVTTEEVMDPITVGGKSALPVVQRADGKVTTTTYYRVEPGAVYVLGYTDPKHFLPEPMPIIKFDGHFDKWTFSGVMGSGRDAESYEMVGQCKGVREQDVLGKRVPVLEVALDATIGAGPALERHEQIAKYAVGIGMVEVSSSIKAGKRHIGPLVRRLMNLEGAKTNG